MTKILKTIVLLVLILAVVSWTFLSIADEKRACEARDGALVRGPIGLSCVKGVGP